jgi:two-component system chemotaxis response regulator CheY
MSGEKVLLADDSQLMLDRMEEELLSLGAGTCLKALNGQDAVNLYKEHRPDLVFLDINMPALDGMQTLQVLRAFDPECWVVMASGVSLIEKVKGAIKLGAKGFMVKPYSTAKIAEALRNFRQARGSAD